MYFHYQLHILLLFGLVLRLRFARTLTFMFNLHAVYPWFWIIKWHIEMHNSRQHLSLIHYDVIISASEKDTGTLEYLDKN